MKSLQKRYEYKATLSDVWDAFVNPATINQWDGGPAVMSTETDSSFSLWGGDIHGKNIHVEEGKILKQEWFGGDWAEPSLVEFSFSTDGGICVVNLSHTNIPDEDFKDINEGWDNYYLGAIQKYLREKKLGRIP